MPDPLHHPHLPLVLRALARATREDPTGRKLLVAPTRGGGKELLRALTRSGTPWMGWDVLTLRPLALDVASVRLAEEGREPLDDVAEQARLDEALDAVVAALPDGPFTEMVEGVGFRRALRGAAKALRLAGVSPTSVEHAPAVDADKRRVLAGVLRAYEAGLERRGEDGARPADTATLLRTAAAVLREGHGMGWDRVWILPGVGRRGLAGRVLDALMERGARLLEADPVEGLPVPDGILWRGGEAEALRSLLHDVTAAGGADRDLALFHAASVTDELKEVLRRASAAGRRWDEVEIVASDPGVYGPALHALAGRMGVPVTFGVGLPVERTRVGRAVEQYVRWLEEGFPSPVIRRLLEAGVIRPPRPHRVSGSRLAERLRRLRVGWGRDRYLPALEAALETREEEVRPRRKETPEEALDRVRRERREIRALRALLAPILSAAPEVPGRLDADPPPVSPAALALGLSAFLEHVPRSGEVERTALDRLQRILRRVEAELTRPTGFAAAVAVLREHLAIRVPAPRAEGPAPWRSTGGHLYLTDLEHGGASGRAATFVVGLDAGRTGTGAYQDPMLLDRERRALDARALPTSGDRMEEARFRLAALLAGLRGKVTLSYSAWDPAEARSVLPSPLLLQAFRLREGDTRLGYRDLHRHLGDPISAVPRGDDGAGRVDAADVWLAALREGGRLREGVDRVRQVHPGLERGAVGRAALGADTPGPHHGLVEARPDRLDPRRSGEVVSASRLETLGHCPRRYFLRYVLGVRPPEDPTLDPDVWLDPLHRGALLHRVYEGTLQDAVEGTLDADDPELDARARDVLHREAERMRREVPPPSEMVHAREMLALEEDVRSFVEWVRGHGLRVVDLERSFGMPGDEEAPVPLTTDAGTLHLRGAIDRVDERLGHLHLMDYKTGSTFRYANRADPFEGGRRLQHVLYSRAAEALYGKGVMSFSYVLPTRRAENHVLTYRTFEYGEGMEVVDRLLDAVASGRFLPTQDPADCAWCDFRRVCRVTGERERLESPLATWGKERFEGLEEYRELREVRRWTS